MVLPRARGVRSAERHKQLARGHGIVQSCLGAACGLPQQLESTKESAVVPESIWHPARTHHHKCARALLKIRAD